MKIALVSEHANPLVSPGDVDAGGQNVHVAALAGGLAARGHDVTVYTRRDNGSDPTVLEAPDGYRVELVPAGPAWPVPKDQMLRFMTTFSDRLRRRWASDRPDLVHAHFWMSGLASVRAARPLGIPVLQTFHALGAVKQRQQGTLDTSPKRRIAVERWLCRNVTHVVATCTDEVAELRDLGLKPGRATIIPCGVDTEVFRPRPRHASDAPRVLVAGRLVTRKGIGNALEAVAALPGVELIVAGGPPADRLAQDPTARRLLGLARELGCADRVRLVGAVDRLEMARLMGETDVVVSVPWYEPFGIVPVEAMACGTPVVGSRVGGLLDTVVPGVTGELVPARHPDRLATVLQRLLADDERRAAYGRAARTRALELYRWDHVVRMTELVYRAVAVPARHPVSSRFAKVSA